AALPVADLDEVLQGADERDDSVGCALCRICIRVPVESAANVRHPRREDRPLRHQLRLAEPRALAAVDASRETALEQAHGDADGRLEGERAAGQEGGLELLLAIGAEPDRLPAHATRLAVAP